MEYVGWTIIAYLVFGAGYSSRILIQQIDEVYQFGGSFIQEPRILLDIIEPPLLALLTYPYEILFVLFGPRDDK